MTEPYDAAAELTKLATWIDTTLDNERADRQHIAEQALARIQEIARALTGRRPEGRAEATARRTAAAALLADYQRAAETADTADRAMWGARLADMLGYLLAAPVPAAQDSTEARKLAGIRAILAGFDWEWHDRQLALEAIERIVLGEEAGQ